MPPDDSEVIRLDSVARRFETPAGPVNALSDASLCANEGEMVAIVGPSGSGKSTLLYILGLLDRPTSGITYHFGKRTDHLTERERTRLRSQQIGFVFQAFRLIRGRTAAQNVGLGLAYAGRRNEEAVARQLDLVGLKDRANTRVELLSGGEQQRVAVARALVKEPKLVLCDEPTGNLDQDNSAQIVTHLRDLGRRGSTVLIITHDATVASLTDRQVKLVDGRST